MVVSMYPLYIPVTTSSTFIITNVLPSEWRDGNEFPDSDVIQIIRDEMVDSEEEGEDPGIMGQETIERHSRKRAMSTVSTLSRQGSPTKKTHQ